MILEQAMPLHVRQESEVENHPTQIPLHLLSFLQCTFIKCLLCPRLHYQGSSIHRFWSQRDLGFCPICATY